MIAHRDPTTPPPGYTGRPRVGGWLQTWSGRPFWPLDPEPEDIVIRDIAHALSQQCRFSGMTDEFYSTAEHCVRMSQIVPQEDALWALLHDASEAYLVDLPRPIKHVASFSEGYLAAEATLMAVITEKFGLPYREPASVKEADLILLETERRDLMSGAELWTTGAKPLEEKITPWWPQDAEHRFMYWFARLRHDQKMGSI